MQRALLSELESSLTQPVETSATDDMHRFPTGSQTFMPRRKVHSIYFGGGTPSLAKVYGMLEVTSCLPVHHLRANLSKNSRQ